MRLSTLTHILAFGSGIAATLALVSKPNVAYTIAPDRTCKQPLQVDRMDRLFAAICKVESNNNPRAVGDGGKALGIAQIHKVMIDDVNRILKVPTFTYTDRLDPVKSREVFDVWRKHYCRDASDEVIARRWNQGMGGKLNAASSRYWKKILAHLK